MSRRNSKSAGPPPSPGIYDGLLFVACGALIAGIVFLCLHLNEYQWQVAP
ncbi:hypothetical protein [Stratiformator vulcanicus]|uniref:Uncharacterized protein n=1 Tax=Stratiformator vulcanicus TaxID=2527980 RepID=A0A517R3S0_9PLAN|nr:hypothetical protein [Stratiformator vulcanicus]QDT38497.1 hypothetical protein Pan189_28910 [Stratiformator vulcanicus]